MVKTVLTASLCLAAATAAAQVPISDKVVTEDRYPERKIAFTGGVTGLPDLVYGTINGYRRLTLDLYLPPGPVTGARPVVVYIHGGGWTGGSPRNAGTFENWPEVLASFAGRGYVVASIEYRFAGEAPFPAALQDTKSAIRWLRANASKYGIDQERIVAWGPSAGGQLAGLAAVTCGVAKLEPVVPSGRGGRSGRDTTPAAPQAPATPPPSDCVQGAVLWYGASDLEMSANTPPPPGAAAPPAGPEVGARQYLACTASGCAQLKAATVRTYVKAGDPPMLLIHGAADTTVPVAQSQRLYAALQAVGVRSELLVLPDINHSFIGKTPEATREAARIGLEKTIAFIDAIVGPKR